MLFFIKKGQAKRLPVTIALESCETLTENFLVCKAEIHLLATFSFVGLRYTHC